MKCKNCGQELTIDRDTGIGVCPDCGKKYKVSTVVKPKVCSDCHVNLVKNGAIWECPNCGKKVVYSTPKKKEAEVNKEEVKTQPDSDVQAPAETTAETTTTKENEVETIPTDGAKVESVDDSKPSAQGTDEELDLDVVIPAEKQTDDETKTEDDDILDDDILDDEKNDTITPEVESQEFSPEQTIEQTPEQRVDIEKELREAQANLQEIEKASQTQKEDDFVVVDEEISQDDIMVAKHSVLEEKTETKPKEKTLPELPKLYDYDGTEYNSSSTASSSPLPKAEAKPVQTLNSLENGSTGGLKNGLIDVSKKKSSKKIKRSGLPFAIIFGILIMLTSIGAYACTFLQSIESLSANKDLFVSLAKYISIAFYLFLAITFFGSLRGEFGDKKIGMFFSALSGVALVVFLLLLTFVPDGSSFKEGLVDNANITTYGIYGCFVFSTFLTLVISCDTESRKKVNSVAIASFVLAIVSTFVLALKMLPLEKLNMSIIQVALPYIDGLDKVILAFSGISILAVTGKSI